MNKEVYLHLFRNYGHRLGYWVGLLSELIRSFMLRVWVAIIMAKVAASLASGDLEAAKYNSILFLVIYAIGATVGTLGDLCAILTENKQYGKLQVEYYEKLTSKDMSFYRDHQSGYLVSLFRQYLDNALTLVRYIRGNIIRTAVSLAAPTVVLMIMDWRLGVLALAIVIVQLVYVIWSSSKAKVYRKVTSEVYRKVTGEVSDAITNIVAYKASGVEKQASSRIAKLSDEEVWAFWNRRRIVSLLDLPRELLTAVGVTAAFLLVLAQTTHGSESVGVIVLTLTYMFQIIRSVSDLPGIIVEHDDMVSKISPTLKYLGTEHEEIKDPLHPKTLEVTKGVIDIEHLRFNYPSHSDSKKEVVVFHDLNIRIESGQRVGIVGLSGAGKSTLASLLLRFDEVTSGAIKIDGLDIREVRQADLHRQVAYVPQEPLLFHRTIRENIAYFNDQASEADIIQAAKAAYAHDFIMQLPDGYDSMVGERGVKLSGGQKQRVVIARAILKNAHIIIFDEATSALDTESEKIIHKALPEIIGNHTALIIAHRLSTIAGLDRILVMHNGEIVEDGTHAQLLKLGGRYASLWQKQIHLEGFEVDPLPLLEIA